MSGNSVITAVNAQNNAKTSFFGINFAVV